MRKIITRDARDKTVKRNQLIMGVVLIGLMVFSTLGFAFSNKISNNGGVEEVEYKGVKFVRGSNGYWSFNVNGNDFLTLYNPKETTDIASLNYLTLGIYSNKPLYFVGEQGEHLSEIVRNLNPFIQRVSSACLPGDDCQGDFPVKDCKVDNVIVLKEADEGGDERIYQEDNCVYIVASFSNQVRYADKFLFEILGIK